MISKLAFSPYHDLVNEGKFPLKTAVDYEKPVGLRLNFALRFMTMYILRLAVLVALMAFSNTLIGQGLMGTKTIPGDYANLTQAFVALNDSGVGPGGVTFHVLANSVFYENPPILSVRGSATSPVVFKKFGNGNNPVIIPANPGTMTKSYLQYGDALIRIAGSSCLTFDGINIQENPLHTKAVSRNNMDVILV